MSWRVLEYFTRLQDIAVRYALVHALIVPSACAPTRASRTSSGNYPLGPKRYLIRAMILSHAAQITHTMSSRGLVYRVYQQDLVRVRPEYMETDSIVALPCHCGREALFTRSCLLANATKQSGSASAVSVRLRRAWHLLHGEEWPVREYKREPDTNSCNTCRPR